MTTPPLERFLGPLPAHDDPRALLDLRASDPSSELIDRALRARLALVDAHKQARSAEADEVRLALHVAAAQLAERAVPQGVDRPADTRRSSAPIAPQVTRDARKQTFLAIIAHSGGWNSTARHRVGSVAHAMGLTLEQAIALLSASTGARAPMSASSPWPYTKEPEPIRDGLGSTRAGRLLLGASGICGLLALLMIGTLVWVIDSRAAGTSSPTDHQASNPAVSNVPAPTVVPPTPAPSAQDTIALLERFNNAAGDPDALAAAYATARTLWVDLEPSAFRSLAFSAAQALATTNQRRPTLLAQLSSDLTDPSRPEAGLFAAAVLARAVDLDRAPDQTLITLVRTLPSMAEGADLAPIIRAPASLLIALAFTEGTQPEAWRRAARAFRAGEPEGAHAAFLALIGSALTDDHELNEAIAQMLDDAVRLREWTIDDADRLLAWWEDETIAIDRLALLSASLVDHGVLGLSPSVALSPSASRADRSRSRTFIARALGRETEEGPDEFQRVWLATLREVTSNDLSRQSDRGLVISIAQLAELNASAAMRWQGDRPAAQAWLDKAIETMPGGEPSGSIDLERFTGPSASPDADWAMAYLSARSNDRDRIALLVDLRAKGGPAGPVDADVLARAALVGSNRAVRQAAQQAVRRAATNPYVLHALLENIHGAARQADVNDLIASVAPDTLRITSARSWSVRVRRALIERFAEQIMRSVESTLARAEARTLEAYASRLPTPDDQAGDEEPSITDGLVPALAQNVGRPTRAPAALRALEHACVELRGHRLRRARAIPEGAWAFRTLDQIERRAASREQYGSGTLQRSALAQLSLVELTGYLVCSERPEISHEVERLLLELEDRWRRARRVTVQIALCERALADLWAMRLGYEAEPKQAVHDRFRTHTAGVRPVSLRPGSAVPLAWEADRTSALRQRLAALSHDEPTAYFELAEDVVSLFPHEDGYRLARELYALAAALAARTPDAMSLSASAALGIAEITPDRADRAWLLIMAQVLLSETASGGPRRIDVTRERGRAAEALALHRAGESTRLRALLTSLDLERVLLDTGIDRDDAARLDAILRRDAGDGMDQDRIDRRSRQKERFEANPSNGGNPGPSLDAADFLLSLRAEMLLVDADPSGWPADLLVRQGEPARDLDPAELAAHAGVSVDRALWTPDETAPWPGGRWSDEPRRAD